MKRKLVVCMDCGYEEKQEFYTREEAEQKNIRLVSPRCKKCGSTNIKSYE
jgi:predicted nucleic-acid-binding Zn-ribbon protein